MRQHIHRITYSLGGVISKFWCSPRRQKRASHFLRDSIGMSGALSRVQRIPDEFPLEPPVICATSLCYFLSRGDDFRDAVAVTQQLRRDSKRHMQRS